MLIKLALITYLNILFICSSCCGGDISKNKPMTIIQRDVDSTARRLLAQSSTPHSLQIKAQYVNSTAQQQQFEVVKVLFEVAAAYYKKVIKVFNLPNYVTQFRMNNYIKSSEFDSSNQCTQFATPNYIAYGFNQSTTDMVVFVTVNNKLNDSTVVTAVGCQFESRLIYGLMEFNARAESDFLKPPPFRLHQQIQTTLHHLTHILGFSSEFYSLFSESPTVYKKVPKNKVIQKMNNRYYIITPKVMEFITNYFNCRDNQTGALLENEQKTVALDTPSSHWQQLVYRDELMTPTNWLFGQRITKLTLALLKDTNFYAEVDDSITDSVYYGSGRGCKFAQGDKLQFSQECVQGGPVTCDFYNVFQRQCKKTEYSDGFPLERFYLSCLYYGQESRCFSSGVNNVASCQNASCSEDGKKITITINQTTKVCEKPGESFTIKNGRLVNCPKNFTVFCSTKSCPNWCNGRGTCVDGKCICMDPFKGKTCTEGCPVYFNGENNKCTEKCPKDTYILNNQTCVKICPYDYLPNDLKKCQYCQGCEKSLFLMNTFFRMVLRFISLICIIFINI